MKTNKQHWFIITRVSRDDVDAQGFDGNALSDKDMEKLAEALEETLMADNQWTDTIDNFCTETGVKTVTPKELY